MGEPSYAHPMIGEWVIESCSISFSRSKSAVKTSLSPTFLLT